ncbi:MAG: ABC transporter permease [Gemmatimonadetes bacterium]|nr:ABC transporter permease [Gemmatimonadota bacterium]
MAARLELRGDVLRICGPLTVATVADAEMQLRQIFAADAPQHLHADLTAIDRLDTGGAVWLHRLPDIALSTGTQITVGEVPVSLRAFYESVTSTDFLTQDSDTEKSVGVAPSTEDLLDRLGDRAYRDVNSAMEFLYVMSDLTWATVECLFRRRGIRQGTFVEQASIIGAQGLGIVTLVLFLVGGVSTLQAAAQLRQFGANVLVADLLAIGITRELGPLMTAIMIAGRSGSAFAAEIATMKFTEEIDALRTMAIDP